MTLNNTYTSHLNILSYTTRLLQRGHSLQCLLFQEDVSHVQSDARRLRPPRQVHPADGHRSPGRLPLQVSQLGVGGDGESRAPHARSPLHPPRLPGFGRALDEATRALPQAQTDQQQPRPERTRELLAFT